jgi:hypothetical protein
VRLEGLGQLKNPVTIGNRTRNLPPCSIVPYRTTLARAGNMLNTISKTVKKYGMRV